MSEQHIREGGCECGAVRYRVVGEPMMVHNCHCRQCQRQTGSTSVVNGFWEDTHFELLSGVIKQQHTVGGSGRSHIICSCADCNTALWSWYGTLGEMSYGVRAGTLDDPTSVRPDVIIFTEEAMPWVSIPGGIPAFPRYYDPKHVLPETSIDRLRALVARLREAEPKRD